MQNDARMLTRSAVREQQNASSGKRNAQSIEEYRSPEQTSLNIRPSNKLPNIPKLGTNQKQKAD